MIRHVIINNDFISYIEKRNLSKQYHKAKNNLLAGRLKQIDFKLREPKKDRVLF